jgi:hypothetical protein
MQIKLIVGVVSAVVLAGCASAPVMEWGKSGLTSADRLVAVSDCEYQIRMNKIAKKQHEELVALCMQGKGWVLQQQAR